MSNLTSTGIPDYEPVKKDMANRHAATSGMQPGDPSAAALRIVDIAKKENLSERQLNHLGLRVPLGTDAVAVMRSKCTDTLEMLREWETFATSTDFGDFSAVPSYS